MRWWWWADQLLPERVLIATYPSRNEEAMACAKKLAAACVEKRIALDWDEMMRVAELPAYRVAKELAQLLAEVERELQLPAP